MKYYNGAFNNIWFTNPLLTSHEHYVDNYLKSELQKRNII